ncbi:MAG: hypothetical protein P8H97_06760 [Pseudomonadales bacterium]|nr:hypothetical protein [Pseudomonadales bacterium]
MSANLYAHTGDVDRASVLQNCSLLSSITDIGRCAAKRRANRKRRAVKAMANPREVLLGQIQATAARIDSSKLLM